MEVQTDKVKLKVEGMTCTGCASVIEQYLSKNEKADIRVNFIEGTVEYRDDLSADLDKVIQGINGLGYKVVTDSLPNSNRKWTIEQKLLISSVFTLPLLVFHLFPQLFAWAHIPAIQFLIALPPILIGFNEFLPGAFHSIRSGSPNMDVTICLGAMAAFIYSLIGWILGDHTMLFFETAASILTLVLLGHYLEHKAVKRTTSSIDALKHLVVDFGKMQLPSGAIVKIPIQDIQKGDFLIVAEGDGIPVDGEVVSGEGHLDEALISGESSPVAKKKGDLLIGASRVLSGNFVLKVSHTGKDSVLGKIINLVKESASQKAPIQNTADRISAVFVPTVLALAFLTFVLNLLILKSGANQSLLRGIAVLVISCPCAMGLATPTAIMVGLGKAMREGILIKGAATLELLGRVKNMILDKTGTLTEPEVRFKFLNLSNEPEIVNMVYAMESRSSHPISKAVLSFINNNYTPHRLEVQVNELKGQGLTAIDEVGNQWSILWSVQSNSIEIKKNTELLGYLVIEDQLKKGALFFIQKLQQEAIQPFILSGDQADKVKSTAQHLNIKVWQGQLMPDQKAHEIAKIKVSGITAMVGDGINDAPALSLADLGVSFADASTIAIQSSQVILLNSNLETLVKAIQVGKLTLKTIRQNLFWAFSYNVVAIPLAALGYLNPMWGAVFMAFSDLVVIGNSLLLRWTKI